MKGIKTFQEINKKNLKIIMGIIGVLWLLFTIFAFQSIRQPLVVHEKVIKNTIEEKVVFDYAAKVKKSKLYPAGGKIVPEGAILTNLTDKLIIQIDANVISDKPVRIEGTTEIVYSIIADDIWKREIGVLPSQQINVEGTSNGLLQKEIQIDPQKLFASINEIEEETLTRQSDYKLIIKPLIRANVYEGNEKVQEINSKVEIPFEVSNQYIRYIGETENKEFVETKTVESMNAIPQSFRLFGLEISIITARYIFSILSLVLLIPIMTTIVTYRKSYKRIFQKHKTEISVIDKKHKNKIIEVSEVPNFYNSFQFGLKDFKSLLQIAENYEESILRYEDQARDVVTYYVLSNNTIYYYECTVSIVESWDLVRDA